MAIPPPERRALILRALRRAGARLEATCDLLDVPRWLLERFLDEYGLRDEARAIRAARKDRFRLRPTA